MLLELALFSMMFTVVALVTILIIAMENYMAMYDGKHLKKIERILLITAVGATSGISLAVTYTILIYYIFL